MMQHDVTHITSHYNYFSASHGSIISVFICNNYIVSAYIKSLREMFDGAGEGNSFKNEYNIGSFRGFSATMKAE